MVHRKYSKVCRMRCYSVNRCDFYFYFFNKFKAETERGLCILYASESRRESFTVEAPIVCPCVC